MKAALAARHMNWPLLATTGQCLLPRHRSSLHLCQLVCKPFPAASGARAAGVDKCKDHSCGAASTVQASGQCLLRHQRGLHLCQLLLVLHQQLGLQDEQRESEEVERCPVGCHP